MARKPGAHGPYRHGNRWRVIFVAESGQREAESFASEKEAQREINSFRLAAGQAVAKTIGEAIDAYIDHLGREKGGKPLSGVDTRRRLNLFFASEMDTILPLLTRETGERLYLALTEYKKKNGQPLAPDTHRHALAQARSMLQWCIDEKKLMKDNALAKVKGVGKKRHGKPQLRIDEARKWRDTALSLAKAGDVGAIAALIALEMGPRASEITTRIVRDLDDDGRRLWITKAKTRASNRSIAVPAPLRELLLKLCDGKEQGDLIFGKHWRDWPRENIQRICKLAGVPMTTAHGMRGLHASLDVLSGSSSEAVAAALGHETFTTTKTSYASRESVSEAQQKKALKVLEGGKRR